MRLLRHTSRSLLRKNRRSLRNLPWLSLLGFGFTSEQVLQRHGPFAGHFGCLAFFWHGYTIEDWLFVVVKGERSVVEQGLVYRVILIFVNLLALRLTQLLHKICTMAVQLVISLTMETTLRIWAIAIVVQVYIWKEMHQLEFKSCD